MNATIQKWGNSLALRIPKSIANEIELEQGDSVEMEVADGVLAVRPGRPRYRLADLVRGITKKSRQDETDLGQGEGSRNMVKLVTRAPRRGDVVWLSFDPQSGHEQVGRRPALH